MNISKAYTIRKERESERERKESILEIFVAKRDGESFVAKSPLLDMTGSRDGSHKVMVISAPPIIIFFHHSTFDALF